MIYKILFDFYKNIHIERELDLFVVRTGLLNFAAFTNTGIAKLPIACDGKLKQWEQPLNLLKK